MSRPDQSISGGARAKLDRLDAYQQRHPALGVPIAVTRKFIEDESINLAAVIAFWAFFLGLSAAAPLGPPARLLPTTQPARRRAAQHSPLSRC